MKKKFIYDVFILCFIFTQYLFPQKILVVRNDVAENPTKIYLDLKSLSYDVDSISANLVTLGLFTNYDVIIVSTGVNNNACSSNILRGEIVNYVAIKGKIIIEGGQIGYNAAISPYFPGFMNKALHISHWIRDLDGNIKLNNSYKNYDLANQPNVLPDSIVLNCTNNFMQDVCINDEYSELFYSTFSSTGYVGVNVFPKVQTPQQIYLAFSYNSILNHQHAIDLIENCVYNLYRSPISVSKIDSIIPKNFQLYQNYPNPFNSSSIIRFDIPSINIVNVSLKVFDILGREIETILDNRLTIGSYQLKFYSDNIPSGILFLKLIVGEYTETKKMIVIK